MVDGQNNVSSHTRNSVKIPLGALGADYVCESTGILLAAEKEFEVDENSWVAAGQTMRCPILASQPSSLRSSGR